ncbi:hypothetical protein [Microbacterium sp. 1P10AE]|uniref:hypothetical protein n=1 Tax=Microbacterium sp. 1P10AE TaxID=3132286 RepID=UPI0039A1C919
MTDTTSTKAALRSRPRPDAAAVILAAVVLSAPVVRAGIRPSARRGGLDHVRGSGLEQGEDK